MSLASQVNALATRVGAEIKDVRADMALITDEDPAYRSPYSYTQAGAYTVTTPEHTWSLATVPFSWPTPGVVATYATSTTCHQILYTVDDGAQVRSWDGTVWSAWSAVGGGGATTLDDLSDVNVSGFHVNGKVLRLISGTWQPDTLTLSDIDDVVVDGLADGMVPVWNSNDGVWYAETPSGGGGGGGAEVQTSAPSNPSVGTIWLDTDEDPPELPVASSPPFEIVIPMLAHVGSFGFWGYAQRSACAFDLSKYSSTATVHLRVVFYQQDVADPGILMESRLMNWTGVAVPDLPIAGSAVSATVPYGIRTIVTSGDLRAAMPPGLTVYETEHQSGGFPAIFLPQLVVRQS